MAIEGNRPLSDDLMASIDSLDAERSSEIELFSMSYLPSVEESQFVRIKGLEGNFPYQQNPNHDLMWVGPDRPARVSLVLVHYQKPTPEIHLWDIPQC